MDRSIPNFRGGPQQFRMAGGVDVTWPGRLAMQARLARDAPAFLRTTMGSAQAVEILRRQLTDREGRFLTVVRETVYAHPRSPYRALLEEARCTFEDLRELVTREGLEAALSALVAAGVYVTFDEFKGRKTVVRGSRRFQFTDADFDNPRVSPHLEATSGGTRGAPTSVKMSLAFVADQAVGTALALDAHGLNRHAHVIWLVAGGMPLLMYAKLGRPPLAWLSTMKRVPVQMAAGARVLAALGRLQGCPLPRPMFHDLADPAGLVAWLHRVTRDGTSICVTTYASSAVRVCVAAAERGVSLERVCFITLGEPYTEAKQRLVRAVGARALVRYAFTEGGIVGYGCAEPRDPDDLHLLANSLALVRRSREVGHRDVRVDALLMTSLLAESPKVLLNVESGDYARVEDRPCACALGAAGLTRHVASVRSFEKLSSEGMTFVRADLLRVLEEVLPGRFGGTSVDYQVVEEESRNGILQVSLIVSPAVGRIDEDAAREALLGELERDGGLERVSIWRRAGTVRVRRQRPVATNAGKILPFHLVRESGSGRMSHL